MPRKSVLANKVKVSKAIEQSSCVKDCLEYLGLRAAGGNYKQFESWCHRHGLTPPTQDKSTRMLAYHRWNMIPLSEVLVKNSSYSRGSLKRRLVSEGVLKEVCTICGLSSQWHGNRLSLQLDHINGVYNDNRIENLRMLCPNCHSQTENFSGKKRRKRHRNQQIVCSECNEVISKHSISKLCRKCSAIRHNFANRKAKRPDKEELRKMIWSKPTTQIAKDFGVSDKAIEKWCKSYGISKPPRGYWAKAR